MKSETLGKLAEYAKAREAHARVVRISDGSETVIFDEQETGNLDAPSTIIEAAKEAIRQDNSALITDGEERYFIHVHNPPRRMAVIGAVHITQPLTQMASLAGFDVTVIDPRGAFATAERFPGVTMMDDWPDEAMLKIAPDSRTAVVTLSHDPKIDDPALAAALHSKAFYIGALGGRKSHGKRLDRLRELGFDDQTLKRINGPVGLDLGGRAPAEIACAILAEAIQHLYKGSKL
jgi:xanthine dehydrogenase accessory factor